MIAIIPARGGSTRIPRKNVREFHGKPIIAYSIETAFGSGLFQHVIVSTDDAEIADVACQYGAKVMARSPDLAQNHIGTQEVMAHSLLRLNKYQTEYVCCIYPCSPLLFPGDLHMAKLLLDDIEYLGGPLFDYAASVGYPPLADAGNFYMGRWDAFLENRPLFDSKTGLVRIPPERLCDINYEQDWKHAEELYTHLKGR